MRAKAAGPLSVLLLVLLMALPAAGADDFDRLRRDASRISSLSADFVQKKSMKILSKPLVSTGKFFYAAPDSIRWEYVKPIRSIVISEKGTSKRYIASGGKMIEDKTGGVQAMKIVLDEVAGWMKGKFSANPSFAASVREGSETVIVLTPTGKNTAGMIEKIEITVSRKDAVVKTVRIVEGAAAETRIDFLRTAVNPALPPGTFQDIP
ncbi:MAG TPA: outer membrane lipoprotein carrier protein LolA [Smithellaceae bacterium]|jgi:outer membrane lipoprotein-sorting protein|nr:outer membrane lipoprotein carrier protein LolA [Smithellaceae bacterium]HNY96702.1 outer membrane lipoprotein carrier protein LolA [Smithellaceae bacterium]HOD64601.1 outer membrane lipoprotein carrier protein LolA [Smithellaceae bacterium]HOH56668.1 outer membrane lipoprotein carrier protein LolA [Smithellaceae bacterium]HPV72306.1 outer membrane lipoprotein carrier protein LolA [Smithellaceae bacterium]